MHLQEYIKNLKENLILEARQGKFFDPMTIQIKVNKLYESYIDSERISKEMDLKREAIEEFKKWCENNILKPKGKMTRDEYTKILDDISDKIEDINTKLSYLKNQEESETRGIYLSDVKSKLNQAVSNLNLEKRSCE